MPSEEAPSVELGSAPENASIGPSPSPSEISSTSSPEPHHVRAPPMFRILAMPPPDPEQPPGQEELEQRLPGYRRIVIPRELTLIELLKQCSGAQTDDEVLALREAKLRVIAERVGLRRLNILVPRLRVLNLDGSALTSLRELGIGLTRLKVLSINRCGLTTLDGIFGLSALRELHAAGNQIGDLQPLAALQKLHTLDLSNNPVSESSRLWTLGICSSLRKLDLLNTPLYNLDTYRTYVASALPMLMYLDERPLHLDAEYDMETMLDDASSSESEGEEMPKPLEFHAPTPQCDAQPSTSKDIIPMPEEPEPLPKVPDPTQPLRRRPATTEGVGFRPDRPVLPPRPHTASTETRPERTGNRLEVMNTLIDEEWRCSGSSLTSLAPVCGNLTHALRRPPLQRRRNEISDLEMEMMAHKTLADAARALADEIPRAPHLEEWEKFRKQTGINIDIDFKARPAIADPLKAIEKLEMIEKETIRRLEDEKKANEIPDVTRYDDAFYPRPSEEFLSYDYDMWARRELAAIEGLENAPCDDASNVSSARNRPYH